MAVPYGYRPPPQNYMRQQIAWAEAYDRRMPFMIPPYLPPDVARAYLVSVKQLMCRVCHPPSFALVRSRMRLSSRQALAPSCLPSSTQAA